MKHERCLVALLVAAVTLGACGPEDDSDSDDVAPDTRADAVADTETSPDTGPTADTADAGPVDAGDTGGADTEGADTGGADTRLTDTGPPDTGGMDTATMDTDGMMDGGPECRDNSDCPGADNICNENGECETKSQVGDVRFLQVKDVTLDQNPGARPQACEGSASQDPGSDLFGIELRDAQSNHKGWANWVTGDNHGASNTHTNFNAVLDGSQPSFMTRNGSKCVDFDPSSVAALGCDDGVGIVEFLDTNGQRVDVESGDELLIYEYGTQCGGSDVDRLNVQPCASTSESSFVGAVPDGDGDYTTCKTQSLGRGGGLVRISVQLP